jgi:hypothetical protein
MARSINWVRQTRLGKPGHDPTQNEVGGYESIVAGIGAQVGVVPAQVDSGCGDGDDPLDDASPRLLRMAREHDVAGDRLRTAKRPEIHQDVVPWAQQRSHARPIDLHPNTLPKSPQKELPGRAAEPRVF